MKIYYEDAILNIKAVLWTDSSGPLWEGEEMNKIKVYNQHATSLMETRIAGFYDSKNIYKNANGTVRWIGTYEIRDRSICFYDSNRNYVGEVERSSKAVLDSNRKVLANCHEGRVSCASYTWMDERLREFCPRNMITGENITVGEYEDSDGIGGGALILLMSELIFLSKEQFQYWKTGHEPYSSQDHDSVGSTGSSAGSTRSSTGNGGNGSGGLGCAWILILPAAVILTGLLYIFIFNVIFDPGAISSGGLKVINVIDMLVLALFNAVSIWIFLELYRRKMFGKMFEDLSQHPRYIIGILLFGVIGAVGVLIFMDVLTAILSIFTNNLRAHINGYRVLALITGFITGLCWFCAKWSDTLEGKK